MAKQKVAKNTLSHPPVVTVLGHVDHGKTTLLDTIRNTSLAKKEFGGITQHIGAYQIETPQGKITFIDTPGHEAFAKMRGRGALVSDVAILVVAGNDGIMPQTIESIDHIKAAKIPCIVAVNKIDLPDINLEKIKKQLVKAGLNLEEYGGETPVIPLSAKTKQGIDKLLEVILLVAELFQKKEQDPHKFQAVVIESELSKTKGPIATIIARSGSLQISNEVICENQSFRVRALNNWRGEKLEQIKAGDPAELLGWKSVPQVGSIVFAKNQTEKTPHGRKENDQLEKPKTEILPSSPLEETKIKIIIKADTTGTLEAIVNGLKNTLEIIKSEVGPITESDILLAKTTHAIVIGFHLTPSNDVVKLAQSEKVIIKTYQIIYELFEELAEVIETIKKGNLVNIFGEAKIIAVFPIKNELVAGIKVISGRIARGDQVKIMRGEQEVGRAKIKSLRFHKEDITKAEQGKEAGILLSQKLDLLTGDSIISIG